MCWNCVNHEIPWVKSAWYRTHDNSHAYACVWYPALDMSGAVVLWYCKGCHGVAIVNVEGNTLWEWVNMGQNNYPGFISEEREWYLLQTLNSVACRFSEFQATPPQGHPSLPSARELFLVVWISRVAEIFQIVIYEITFETHFKLVILLHALNENLTNEDLNTRIDKRKNRWNIHVISCGTLTSRAKPSSNILHPYCLCSFRIFDESHS